MTRLGILTLMGIGILSALLGSAILYGHMQSESSRLRELGFNVCDGTPCWNRVVPGVTDWQTLQAISTAHKGTELTNTEDTIAVKFDINGSYISAVGFKKENLVAIISADSTASQIASGISTLENVLDLFGAPCGVDRRTDTLSMALMYPNAVINVPVTDDKVDLNTPISGITILAPTLVTSLITADLCKSDSQLGYVLLPWQGLRSPGYYYAEGLKLAGQ